MAEWSFAVAPGLTVTLRAAKHPALLSLALGREVERVPAAELVLDLGGEIEPSAPTERGRYKAVPWRCQRTKRDDKQTIVFQSPLFREYLALHIALLPALREVLLERKIALVVGAAFKSRGSAALLAGETGSGKTSALLKATARGAQLIGDEYVAISASGLVTPALRLLALRRGALAGVPELARRLNTERRLALLAAALAAKVSLGRLDPLVHVSPEEIGLGQATGGALPLSTLIWLDSSPRADPVAMSNAEAIEALLGVSRAHDRAYGVPLGDSTRWYETLSRGLKHVRCLRAGTPLAPGVLERVLSVSASGSAAGPIS